MVWAVMHVWLAATAFGDELSKDATYKTCEVGVLLVSALGLFEGLRGTTIDCDPCDWASV